MSRARLVGGLGCALGAVLAIAPTLVLMGILRMSILRAVATEDTVMVMVAARDLPTGSRVVDTDLVAIEIPPSLVHAAVFTSPERVVGARLVEPVFANDILNPSRITPALAALACQADCRSRQIEGLRQLVAEDDPLELRAAAGRLYAHPDLAQRLWEASVRHRGLPAPPTREEEAWAIFGAYRSAPCASLGLAEESLDPEELAAETVGWSLSMPDGATLQGRRCVGARALDPGELEALLR
ncbi:MAG: SAF domain-containing protein [Alphaproteobacteria bacterium]|nr:SAF domain-containing protein [Alphaproteobacteria bacterium]